MREAKRHIAGFLVAAFCLSILTAYLVYSRVQEVEAQLGDRVNVLVAARDIPAQVPLTENHLSTVSLPEAFLQPGMVSDPKEVVGKVSLVPLPRGALILSHAVADRVVIPDGKRVIRMYRSQVVVFDENLMVGDAVDLVVTATDPITNTLRTYLRLRSAPVVEVDPGGTWVGIEVPEQDAASVVGLQVTAQQLYLLRVTPEEGRRAS